MTARVSGRMRAATESGSMLNVSGSTSAKSGVAPHIETLDAVAKNVNAGTITESPGPMPAASSAAWSAAVPELTPTAWAAPQ